MKFGHEPQGPALLLVSKFHADRIKIADFIQVYPPIRPWPARGLIVSSNRTVIYEQKSRHLKN